MKLPANAGMSSSEQARTHDEWNTFDDVQVQLMREGFMPSELPRVACQRITADQLTTQDNDKYTQLYTSKCAWLAYTSDTLARTKGERLQVENEMDYIQISLRTGAKMAATSSGVKKPTDKEIEELVELDPRYKELKILLQRAKQREGILSSDFETLDRELKMISRVLVIKQMEFNDERQGGNLPNRMPGKGYPR